MDFKKIFIKDANPTKIGGQAVLEGIMMKGEKRTAVVVRAGKNRMYIKTDLLKKRSKAAEIPIVRGVYIFVTTLMTGMKTLIDSAEMIERFEEEGKGAGSDGKAPGGAKQSDAGSDGKGPGGAAATDKEPGGAAAGDKEPVGKKPDGNTEKAEKEDGVPFGVMIALSVTIAIAFVVGIFIIAPTAVVNLLGAFTDSAVALNIFEGVFRIALFVIYIAIISRMKEIQATFEYHGAEHKTIHCFESGLPLTPRNAAGFETLHPRCGTSFLMFVMVIALLLFSLLGWPNLAVRIVSRLAFIPLIAGLSYELLRFAGSRDNALVRVLSIPGLLLQKLTTRVPSDAQLEIAIAALKAVLVPEDAPEIEGFCDIDGNLLPEEDSLEFQSVLEGL